MSRPAHRLRRARPERQADAGRAAARSPDVGTAAACGCCRFPTIRPHRRARSGGRCAASASTRADVMQLLYVANRYEWKARDRAGEGSAARSSSAIATWRRASPTAKRRGSTRGWLAEIQKYLPQPDLTFLLDIPPEVSARRKTADRDKYERDLSLLARVRDSYLRQACDDRLDAAGRRCDAGRPPRPRTSLAADVLAQAVSATTATRDSATVERPHLTRARRPQAAPARTRPASRRSSARRRRARRRDRRRAATRAARGRQAKGVADVAPARGRASAPVCDGVARIRQSACTTGRSRPCARSRA